LFTKRSSDDLGHYVTQLGHAAPDLQKRKKREEHNRSKQKCYWPADPEPRTGDSDRLEEATDRLSKPAAAKRAER
jgi:hypothetical protein